MRFSVRVESGRSNWVNTLKKNSVARVEQIAQQPFQKGATHAGALGPPGAVAAARPPRLNSACTPIQIRYPAPACPEQAKQPGRLRNDQRQAQDAIAHVHGNAQIDAHRGGARGAARVAPAFLTTSTKSGPGLIIARVAITVMVRTVSHMRAWLAGDSALDRGGEGVDHQADGGVL